MMLEGKTALITGGTSGIGLAVAQRFLREGARVVVASRDAGRCQSTAATLAAIRGADAVRALVADISRAVDVQQLVAGAINAFGHIDLLVNSAGVYLEKRLEETCEAEWDRLIDVNLKGTYLCCREIYPHFRAAGGGVIVNISSDAGVSGNRNCAAYCAAKGGVSNLTRALALDYARENIRVNAVCPAVIDTPMLQAVVDLQQDQQAYLQQAGDEHPSGRIGTAEEVAFAVLMLASDEAGFTTGANLCVDGGITA